MPLGPTWCCFPFLQSDAEVDKTIFAQKVATIMLPTQSAKCTVPQIWNKQLKLGLNLHAFRDFIIKVEKGYTVLSLIFNQRLKKMFSGVCVNFCCDLNGRCIYLVCLMPISLSYEFRNHVQKKRSERRLPVKGGMERIQTFKLFLMKSKISPL